MAFCSARAGFRSARAGASAGRRQEGRSGFVHPRNGRRGLSETAEGSAAVRGLSDIAGAANGFNDCGRETAGGQFSLALRAENSESHSALRVADAYRATIAFGGAAATAAAQQTPSAAPHAPRT